MLNPNKLQPPFLSLSVKSYMSTSFSYRNLIQFMMAHKCIGVSSNSEKVIRKCENMPFAKYKRIEMARTRGCQFSCVVSLLMARQPTVWRLSRQTSYALSLRAYDDLYKLVYKV